MYTIDDFLNGRIYVQCNNEEERQQLKTMSGWNGKNDALNRRDPAALYRHHRYPIVDGYGYTYYSQIGSPYYENLPIIQLEDLEGAMAVDIWFDDVMFMEMLGCGGDGE